MILVLSPSKTLDYETPIKAAHTQPEFLKDAVELVEVLRGYTPNKLSALMDISDKLAQLNAQRYRDFTTPFTVKNARQALLAFKGDVYEGIDIEHYSAEDFAFAQKHLRILSGLYGVLRPLDLMQPYRLEMGTRLKNAQGKNLYDFWGERITQSLNKALKSEDSGVLVNLASEEYFHAVRAQALKGHILHIQFKEKRGNKLQIIGLMAKKARGVMTDWVIRNRLYDINMLKNFNESGYRYEDQLSTADTVVFVR